MKMISRLPEVIVREICELLSFHDQYQFLSASKVFLELLSTVFRRCVLKFNCGEEELQKILRLVRNPSKQLLIKVLEANQASKLSNSFSRFDSCHSLCSGFQYYNDYFHHSFPNVEHLVLMVIGEEFFPSLQFQVNCQVYLHTAVGLLLEKYWSRKNKQLNLTSITINGLVASPRLTLSLPNSDFSYPTSLKSCALRFLDFSTLPLNFFSGLQSLTIANNAVLENVALFDFIPFLTLHSCPNIRDVSGLNHNRSIQIHNCNEIFDFRHSFAKSEVISLTVYSFSSSRYKERLFDLSHYSCARSISLYGFWHPTVPLIFPSTLKRFTLQGLESVELQLNWTWQLHFLQLEDCSSLTSVRGLGRIPVLALINLANLKSLDGLGPDNRVLILERCENLCDCSAIGRIDEVRIRRCAQWISYEQVQFVHRLTLQEKRLITIEAFGFVEHLTLINCTLLFSDGSWLTGPKFLEIRMVDDPSDITQIARQKIIFPKIYEEIFLHLLSERLRPGALEKIKFVIDTLAHDLLLAKTEVSTNLLMRIQHLYEETVLFNVLVYLRRRE